MTRLRALSLIALLTSGVLAACSSDDDDADSSPTAPEDTSGAVESSTATTGTTTDATATGATTDGEPETSGTTSSAGSTPPTVTDDQAGGDGDDLADVVAELEASVPGGRRLGLAGPSWNRVVHTAEQSNIPADEIDPFEGLANCPDQVALPNADAPWVERRFRADTPVDGVITVRVAAINQNAPDYQQFTDGLRRCKAVSPELFMEVSDREVDVDGDPVDAIFVDVLAPATGVVPFPAQVAYLAAHDEDITAVVSVFGESGEVGFLNQAEHLLQVTLAGLA